MWSGITPRFAPRSWDARLGARRAVQLAKQASCNDAVRPNPPVQIGEVISDHILSKNCAVGPARVGHWLRVRAGRKLRFQTCLRKFGRPKQASLVTRLRLPGCVRGRWVGATTTLATARQEKQRQSRCQRPVLHRPFDALRSYRPANPAPLAGVASRCSIHKSDRLLGTNDIEMQCHENPALAAARACEFKNLPWHRQWLLAEISSAPARPTIW